MRRARGPHGLCTIHEFAAPARSERRPASFPSRLSRRQICGLFLVDPESLMNSRHAPSGIALFAAIMLSTLGTRIERHFLLHLLDDTPPPPSRHRMKDVARPTRSQLVRLFEQQGLKPRHDLGQNFLVDLNLLDLIVRHAR